MTKRPRSEDCQRLTLATVLPLVQPGTEALTLADGTVLALRWGVVRGCYGGDREGRALLLICPSCGRRARVLHRPPSKAWSCWNCTPISRRSHRRPGARAGQPKPRSWRRHQIGAEQRRCAYLLGLASWPPRSMFWTGSDLLALPRRPGAPRISPHRACMLAIRLSALETLWWMLPEPRAISRLTKQLMGYAPRPDNDINNLQTAVARQLQATAWAVRRPSRDRRRSGEIPHRVL
ncbi:MULTISPECIES: hypothetical protein [unclassified Cyanobium]|uniref:hypothetical protein n=1 Tax=unclassified Cyanobium TaxID=2627006 RepID=UPI0020CE38B7|nr:MULTISPECIES: hypothetical protein [unclassified Cyanobium]MCP9861088.1 hypothetical protein [Cyanobium sp. Cruz-8H5]MCP9868322.1 hypothetical protein [Cyanobium sp. Cruz-8D1]